LVVPGALAIFFASHIRRRRRWSIVSMIVLVSLELVVVLPTFARAALFTLRLRIDAMVPLAISGLFIAAFILLIVQLSRCFGVLKIDAIDYDRGFAPIMAAPTVERFDEGAGDAVRATRV